MYHRSLEQGEQDRGGESERERERGGGGGGGVLELFYPTKNYFQILVILITWPR